MGLTLRIICILIVHYTVPMSFEDIVASKKASKFRIYIPKEDGLLEGLGLALCICYLLITITAALNLIIARCLCNICVIFN